MRQVDGRRCGRHAVALLAYALMGMLPMCAQGAGGAVAPTQDPGQVKGRQLLDQMVRVLGSERWVHRDTERLEGKSATFYKSAPNPYETQFEEYLRLRPFGERIVIVSKQGILIPTSKRDVAEVWNAQGGYEITYRGRKELPKPDVEDFERRQRHTLDVVVNDWLKRPDTLVTYEGSGMEERRLVDKVTVLTAENDAVTLALDQETHLPRSRTFQWRDATYKDFNTDTERYDDWQPEEGIMTALTITRFQNGDMVSQRFLTKVQYGLPMAPDLFNPDRPLSKK
ncbi:MAG: hypothetical protein INR62_09490 [Rhodospirillales bacterium]|nr:hypothetical protein [Acetobacter sp.]